MLSLELIKELCLLLGHCSDSDIEDFIDGHHLLDEEAKEVWEIVAINNAPECCKDCSFVICFPDIHPCDRCIRPREDFYKDCFKKKQ